MIAADITINLSHIAEWITVLSVVTGAAWAIWSKASKTLSGYNEALSWSEQMLHEQQKINAKQDERLENFCKSLKPMEQGIQQILRFRIEREAARIIAKKKATRKEKESLYRLHEVYEALGQNGLIGDLYQEAMSQETIER